MSVPPSLERRCLLRGMKFFPHSRCAICSAGRSPLGVLGALAALFPWELGEKADPFAPAYPGIRPEWYFVFMFETLKLVPGGEIFGIGYEAIPILLFGLGGLLLVLVPFLDRGVARTGRSPAFTVIGVLVVAYMTALTAWGYRSWVPVAVVAATVVFVIAMGLAVDVDWELLNRIKSLLRGDRKAPP